MSSEWKEVSLEALKAPDKNAFSMGPFGSKIKAENFVDCGVPVIKGGNLNSSYIDEGAFDFLTPEKAAELSASKARRLDIVVTHRGTLGQVGIIPEDSIFPEYVVSQSQLKLSFDRSKVSPYFIYYFLKSPLGQGRLLANTSQVGVPAIAQALTTVRNLKIILPPLSEQWRVVELLRVLDRRIFLLRETNTTLEKIAKALFKSWFVSFDPVRAKADGRQPEGMDAATAALFPNCFEDSELGQIPKGWRAVRLGEVTERITKGTTPTTLKRPFVQSGINFVKAESITDDGQLLPEKFAYIDDETHRLLGRSQLKAGDVLITIAGTIGRVSVITEDFIPANTNQAVALVRPDAGKLPSLFVNQFLRLADSKMRMGERVVQAVQANLSLGSLSEMKLVMPPPELVKRLHDLVFDCVESKKHSNQKKIRTLTQLRDTLLPRLISGQLRLPEAEEQAREALV